MRRTPAAKGNEITRSFRVLLAVLVAGAGGMVAFATPGAAQTISSAANQSFTVGNAATAMSAITITEDGSPQITSGNDIRIRIPTGFNMTWNPAITTATITGPDASKVSTTVTYESSNRVLRLNVTTTWAANDQITVSGLQFTNFTAASAADNLELVISGSSGGATAATDDKTITILAPSLSDGTNQFFTVGDPATAMSTSTITDAATAPTITAAGDIRLRIPASLNMVWNTALTTATIGGGAAAKVSTAVTYEDANKTLVLNVTSNFVASDQITVSGLQFTSFTAVSAAAGVQLVVSGTGGGTAATSSTTKRIVQPTILGAGDQWFSVGDAATNISTLTITDNATSPSITAGNDIRVRIPAALNMTWNTADVTAAIGGSAAGKVSTTVSYEDAGRTLVINVTSNFVVNDQIGVGGLQYNNFTAPSGPINLELVVSGPAGATADLDTRTIQIYPALAISSAANQVFPVTGTSTAISAITITEDASASITTANDIRIRIPASFNMTWDTSDGTATIGGAAASKVSTTVTYEDGGKVLRLNVTTAFANLDQIIVSGLSFNNFTVASPAANLELVTSGAFGGPTVATDDKTKTIVGPTLSSAANQVFAIADPATAMSALTVTDNPALATINLTNDIRVRIPAGLNMTWNTAVTTATITGSASGKVATAVTYESGGTVLRLNVTTSFALGDQITVSGLQFNNFTAASAAQNLELVISGSAGGATAATDDKTKSIVAPSFTEASGQGFTVGDPATAMTIATITDAASSATITVAGDIRLRIPASLNMTWNTAATTATIGGAAAAKVSTTVTYEDAGKTLVLNVTSAFAPGDQITASGLQFNNFTATSAAAALQLVVSGTGGGTTATSNNTKQIYAQIAISSAANLMYNVGMGAHASSAITVTGDASAQINTANDIRIRIPAALDMTWLTSDVTATIGGAAAAKVSSTVSYEDAGKTLVLNVVTNFAPGDAITVSALQYANFTAISAANNLELAVGGAGSATMATDDKTISIVAAFGITSVADQTFVVAQAAGAMSAMTVTDSATTPRITSVNDIRIQIPAALNMTWNTAITTATITGPASAKVSTAVTYESGNKVVRLNVSSNFAIGDQITFSGLQFNNFSAPSAADDLELVVAGAGGATVATDDKTKTIVAPSFAEAANQLFSVNDAATAMAVATVTDNAAWATITAAGDIRLRIPASLNMIWNTGVTTATIGGAASSKVSTAVTYEDASKTLVLNVTSDFAPSDEITVSGPEFTSFTAISAAAPLQMVVSGSGGGTAVSSSNTKQIYAQISISSAANLSYNVGMGAHAIGTITVTGDGSSQINTTNDIRIRIPAALNMTWNTADVTATIGGAAAAKVSSTVSYEDGGKTLVLNVVTNFAPSDAITIAALQYDNFTAISAANSLELVTGGAGGATVATDNRTVSIIAQFGISSVANQTFVVAQAATAMSAITVTDSTTTPRITATNDIRIRIPASLNMTWNTAITTATITGPDAAKVSTTVTYENAGKVLRVNVTTSFTAGDQIVVSGLQFNNFTAPSAADDLEFVVSGAAGGPTAGLDDKTKTIFSYGADVTPATTTASRLPSNGTNYTVLFTVQNTGSTTDSYDLLVTRSPGTAVTTVSMTGAGVTQGANPDSARLTGLASAGSSVVTVTYSVANVGAGTTDALTMTARSTTDPTKTDAGVLTVTVIKPDITISRTRSPLGSPPPATEITHTITITNGGTATADGLVLADSLGSSSDFKVGSVITNLPAGITVAVEYSSDGGASWTYSPVSGGCGVLAGFDGCVNRVRWRLLNSLSSISPNHTGDVQFVSRIR